MRRLILQMQISLDGFVSGPGNRHDWIFTGLQEEFAEWCVGRLWDAGAHLMGRVTYGDMAAYWPTSTEPYARPMNDIPKIVFSRTLRDAKWGESRVVAGDMAREIARLKSETGKDLLAHGGAGFARSLVQTGLVDEYRLVTHPVALGTGRSPFAGLAAPVRLALVDAVTFRTGVIAKTLRPVQADR